MPGIHFITSINRVNSDLLKRAGEEVILKRNYEHSSLFENSNTSISFSGYDGYPCLFHEERDYIFLIEGLIYNISDREIINRLKSSAEADQIGSTPEKEIRDFIEQADGDYLIVIYDKKQNKTILFNDRWGRLPTYYYADEESFIISREMKFILNLVPSISIDKIAVAEFLSLEFNLGDKTLFKETKSLGPSSLIQIERHQSRIEKSITQLIPINFDKTVTKLARRDAIRNGCEIFYNSVRSRVEKADELDTNITADFSGGFDTRAIIGALSKTGAQFTVCTDDIITANEFEYTNKAAESLDIILNSYIAEHPVDGLEELSSITYITDGSVNSYINTACFYDDLERQKDLPNRRMNFMGLGGEFMRNVYKKKRFYKNIPSMLIDDAFTHAIDLRTAVKLVDIEKQKMIENFNNEFKSLEEKTLDGKMRHLFFDYYHKAVNAGENRHRIFNWTISPFWNNNLIGFLMQKVPHMIDYDFYLRFLKLLDNRLLSSPFYPSRLSLRSLSSRLIFKTKLNLKAFVRDNRFLCKWAKSMHGKSNDMDIEEYRYLIDELYSISEKSLLIKSCFNLGEIKKFVSENKSIYDFYQLLTIILYFNEIEKRFTGKILI